MKTLDQAIGCWTTSDEGLRRLCKMVVESVALCRRQTVHSNMARLYGELGVLEARLKTMLEVTQDAQRRLLEIVKNKECE